MTAFFLLFSLNWMLLAPQNAHLDTFSLLFNSRNKLLLNIIFVLLLHFAPVFLSFLNVSSPFGENKCKLWQTNHRHFFFLSIFLLQMSHCAELIRLMSCCLFEWLIYAFLTFAYASSALWRGKIESETERKTVVHVLRVFTRVVLCLSVCSPALDCTCTDYYIVTLFRLSLSVCGATWQMLMTKLMRQNISLLSCQVFASSLVANYRNKDN